MNHHSPPHDDDLLKDVPTLDDLQELFKDAPTLDDLAALVSQDSP